MGWGGLFDYSVKPGPDLSRFRLGLVRLVTRSAKARWDQVGDQVGQGHGQELDNIMPYNIINLLTCNPMRGSITFHQPQPAGDTDQPSHSGTRQLC